MFCTQTKRFLSAWRFAWYTPPDSFHFCQDWCFPAILRYWCVSPSIPDKIWYESAPISVCQTVFVFGWSWQNWFLSEGSFLCIFYVFYRPHVCRAPLPDNTDIAVVTFFRLPDNAHFICVTVSFLSGLFASGDLWETRKLENHISLVFILFPRRGVTVCKDKRHAADLAITILHVSGRRHIFQKRWRLFVLAQCYRCRDKLLACFVMLLKFSPNAAAFQMISSQNARPSHLICWSPTPPSAFFSFFVFWKRRKRNNLSSQINISESHVQSKSFCCKTPAPHGWLSNNTAAFPGDSWKAHDPSRWFVEQPFYIRP